MESLFTYIRRQLDTQYSVNEIKSLASIICSDSLNISTIELYTGKYTDLSADKAQKIQDIVERLLRHEPIQYIIGTTIFCNLMFKVTPDVLIPRPETEELVNLIAHENNGKVSILDIGTGSGCIAISLNKRLPETSVTGWDISKEALKIATCNNSNIKTDVNFKERDIFNLPPNISEQFDIIVSNPPYVTEKEKEEMQPEVLYHEPSIALFVEDNDPLRYYRQIAEYASKALKTDGKLYFEINQRFGKETAEILQRKNFKQIRILKDFYQNDRIVAAIR